jgi:hypothetical protein
MAKFRATKQNEQDEIHRCNGDEGRSRAIGRDIEAADESAELVALASRPGRAGTSNGHGAQKTQGK